MTVDLLHGNYLVRLSDRGNTASKVAPPTAADFSSAYQAAASADELIGRDAEVTVIRQALDAGTAVEFHAPCGYGVSALLRTVASTGSGRHGRYIYLSLGAGALPDVLHRVVGALFVPRVPGRVVRPSAELAKELLRPVRVVLVLDDVACAPDVLAELIAAMPNSRFVIGAGNRILATGPGTVSHRLRGLAAADARRLLERELGRPLPGAQVEPARLLAQAVDHRPLHLRQAAALVRGGEVSFAELARRVTGHPEQMDDLAIAALPTSRKRLLATMAVLGGAALTKEQVAEVTAAISVRDALGDLTSRGLLDQHLGDRFGLPICKVEHYRSSTKDQVDFGRTTQSLVDSLRKPMSAGSAAGLAGAALEVARYAAQRQDSAAAVRLIKVAQPVVTLAGQVGEYYETVRHLIEGAARITDVADRAHLTHQLGVFELCSNQVEQARHHLDQAARLADQIGNPAGAATSRQMLDVARRAGATPSAALSSHRPGQPGGQLGQPGGQLARAGGQLGPRSQPSQPGPHGQPSQPGPHGQPRGPGPRPGSSEPSPVRLDGPPTGEGRGDPSRVPAQSIRPDDEIFALRQEGLDRRTDADRAASGRLAREELGSPEPLEQPWSGLDWRAVLARSVLAAVVIGVIGGIFMAVRASPEPSSAATTPHAVTLPPVTATAVVTTTTTVNGTPLTTTTTELVTQPPRLTTTTVNGTVFLTTPSMVTHTEISVSPTTTVSVSPTTTVSVSVSPTTTVSTAIDTVTAPPLTRMEIALPARPVQGGFDGRVWVATVPLQITNPNNDPVTLDQLVVQSVGNPAAFTVTPNQCPDNPLPKGEACPVTVLVSAGSLGAYYGVLTVGGPQVGQTAVVISVEMVPSLAAGAR